MSSPRVRALLLTLLTVTAIAPAHASGPWLLRPGEFHSEFRGGYYSTVTLRDADGERPPLGGTFEGRRVVNSTYIGWKGLLNLRFDIPFESITARPDFGVTNTQSGLSDLLLGFKLKVLDGAAAVAIEGLWKAPLGYNDDLFPMLGNGRQEAIGLVHLGGAFPVASGFFQVAGGYRTAIDQSDDFAEDDPRRLFVSVGDEVLATADVGLWFGPSLLVAGSYRGGFERGDAENLRTAHRVGPRVLYRVDDHLDVFAGSLHTAAAENTLHLDEFYVGIATKATQLSRLQGFLGSKRRP